MLTLLLDRQNVRSLGYCIICDPPSPHLVIPRMSLPLSPGRMEANLPAGCEATHARLSLVSHLFFLHFISYFSL
jgi:hypothetical protein